MDFSLRHTNLKRFVKLKASFTQNQLPIIHDSRTNVLAERMVRTFKTRMTASGEDQATSKLRLQDFLFTYRNTPRTATGKSSTELMFGRRLTCLLDNKFLTIKTHKGYYQYNRMPFGITTAPSIFQQYLEKLLGDMKHVAVYFDDIAITGTNDTEHLETLEKVFDKLENAGLKINFKKRTFLQK